MTSLIEVTSPHKISSHKSPTRSLASKMADLLQIYYFLIISSIINPSRIMYILRSIIRYFSKDNSMQKYNKE